MGIYIKICKSCNKVFPDEYICCPYCCEKVISYEGKYRTQVILSKEPLDIKFERIDDKLDDMSAENRVQWMFSVLFSLSLGTMGLYFATKDIEYLYIAVVSNIGGVFISAFSKSITAWLKNRIKKKST
ncbi:MAG: hypothetical protein JSU91_08760 [Thermoplasmatales archaeon]|nr:MAG: hypothetical protein JSU91_08760 [Thermoplasmatales archaeon]